MNKTARNEEKKLSAAYLNGVAIAVLAVGVFAPTSGFATNGQLGDIGAVFGVGCLVVSIALHLFGRLMLRSLEE